jgi:hypothetical protein
MTVYRIVELSKRIAYLIETDTGQQWSEAWSEDDEAKYVEYETPVRQKADEQTITP